MYCNVLAIECTVERPRPELGDAAMSPLFHRVSAACPVLSLFGYVRAPACTPLVANSAAASSAPLSSPDARRVPAGQGEPQAAGSSSASTLSPQPLAPLPRSPRAAVDSAAAPSGGHMGSVPGDAPSPQWSVCVHVHGCYPYFLVPQYDRAVSAVQFGAQLEAVAMRAALQAVDRRRAPSHGQLIHQVEVVERIPFYGYHARTHPFYKVSVIDPGQYNTITALLQETTEVGGRSWQLYEAHCPYHSQFMIDHDLKGFSTFVLPPCHVRAPVGVPEMKGRSAGWLRQHCGIVEVVPADVGDGRRTVAQLEVDVESKDLLAQPADPSAPASTRARQPLQPGAHLAHVRGLIRRYFEESSVPDDLRRADTIAVEDAAQEAWRTGRLPTTSARADAFVPRYGSVSLIQRCDPVARALRAQMLEFMRARLGRKMGTVKEETDTGSPAGCALLAKPEGLAEVVKDERAAARERWEHGQALRKHSSGLLPVRSDARTATTPPPPSAYLADTQPPATGSLGVCFSAASSPSSQLPRPLEQAEERPVPVRDVVSERRVEAMEDAELPLTYQMLDALMESSPAHQRPTDAAPASVCSWSDSSQSSASSIEAAPESSRSSTGSTRGAITADGAHGNREQSATPSQRSERGGAEFSSASSSSAESSSVETCSSRSSMSAPADGEPPEDATASRAQSHRAVAPTQQTRPSDERAALSLPHRTLRSLQAAARRGPSDVCALSASELGLCDDKYASSHGESPASESTRVTGRLAERQVWAMSQRVDVGEPAWRGAGAPAAAAAEPTATGASPTGLGGGNAERVPPSRGDGCAPGADECAAAEHIGSDVPLFSSSSSSSASSASPLDAVSAVEVPDSSPYSISAAAAGAVPSVVIEGSLPAATRPPHDWALTTSGCGNDVDGISRLFAVKTAAVPTSSHAATDVVGTLTRVTAALPSLSGGVRAPLAVAEARGSAGPALSRSPAAAADSRRATRSFSASDMAFRISRLRVLLVEVLPLPATTAAAAAAAAAGNAIVAVALGRAFTDTEVVGVKLLCVAHGQPPPAQTSAGSTAAAARARVHLLAGGSPVEVQEVGNEAALLRCAAREMRAYDPDLILSWEGFKYGLGMLALRYRAVLGDSLAKVLSRYRCSDPPARPSGAGDEAAPSNSSAQTCSQRGGRHSAAVVAAAVRGSVAGSAGGSDADERVEDEEEEEAEPDADAVPAGEEPAHRYAQRFGAVVRVAGRVCRSLGKDMRKQVKLPSYTLAMAHQQILHRSFPFFSDEVLAGLYTSAQPGDRFVALSYLCGCLVACQRIAVQTRYYARAAEFSAMYGILFEEVIHRGSQFRVEATLVRMARPQNYAMLSPSRAQILQQPRIQCIPLVMQPRSGFYRSSDPIIVLDFRSLYPSVAIAYNLCYSTCVGLVQPSVRGRLGVIEGYKQDHALLHELLPDDEQSCPERAPAGSQHADGARGGLDGGNVGVTISPNGALFLTPSVRRGVLPQMLQAVLDTRFEVQAARRHVAVPLHHAEMEARLDERQLALKMLANVTYGYTGASYTGRMPCVDLAEAIVSLGRQTLERAIAMIHASARWNAEVVYGDTDSVFVRLGGGRSRAEAFAVGAEIARAVTAANPVPVQLQFEKVLSPCLLLVKKRYVGYAWFHKDQQVGTFLEKGIETVRRDQCPITSRVARTLLTYLLDSDVRGDDVHSESWRAGLRAAYEAEVVPLLRGVGHPADFVFRRSVKLGRYSNDSHLPLAARLALKQLQADALRTPHWGERLSYVIVQRLTSTRLPDQVAPPEALLYLDSQAVVDTDYYILRNINSALDRMFHFVGVSFRAWLQALPRTSHTGRYTALIASAPCPPKQIMQPVAADGLRELLRWCDRELAKSAESASLIHARKRRRSPTIPRTEEHARRLAGAASRDVCVVDMMSAERSPGGVGRVDTGSSGGAGQTQAFDVDGADAVVERSVEAESCASVCSMPIAHHRGMADLEERTDPSNTAAHTVQQSFLTYFFPAGRAATAPVAARVTLEDYYHDSRCVMCSQTVVPASHQQRVAQWFLHRVALTLLHEGSSASRSSSRLAASPPDSLLFAVPLPPAALILFPPICERCLEDPWLLLCRATARTIAAERQLHAVEAQCQRCLGMFADADHADVAHGGRECTGSTAERGEARTLAELEDLVESDVCRRPRCPTASSRAAATSVPADRAAAVVAHPQVSRRAVLRGGGGGGERPEARGTADGSENVLGCSSCDCRLNFDKCHLTLLTRQLQLLLAYVQRLLG